jgi:enoyl-CoA hydratase/carnithine racemase
MGHFKDIGVEKTGRVALVEIRRPPHNYFDVALIRELATAFGALDADPGCRALMLAAQGKAFCAGANFSDDDRDGSALLGGPTLGTAHLYIEGNRLSVPRSRSSLPFTARPSAAGRAWRWWPIFG